MPLMTYLSRDEAERLAQRILSFTTADEARVNIGSGTSGNTRFANGEITTSGGTTDTSVSITVAFGTRSASASTNILDDASLRRTVELAERLAKLAPEDPEFMPELGSQQYATVSSFAQATADLTPEARTAAVQRALDAVYSGGGAAGLEARSLFVAGFLEANRGSSSAVATKRGLFAYQAGTSVDFSVTVRTPDGTGSGYASIGARDWGTIDAAAIGRRAAGKAVASRNPQAIEPGRYTVVLEPQAVADLVPLMLGSFNARTAEEGRSPFSAPDGKTKLGEKIADSRVTILSDPTDPDLLQSPFTGEGLPLRRIVWVENGILRNLAYSRFWAQKRGVEPTGGGGGGGGFGGAPGGLKMTGGTKTTDQLVAETERGVLVTRFWYIRFLDQRTVLVTGLTRDGTFLIENGRITRPLKNFRFNESPLFMLNKLDELGRTERTSTGIAVPSMRVKDFTFTSLSDAV